MRSVRRERYRQFRPGLPEPISGFDQIAGRFFEGNRPCASVPTSAPSGCLSNRSGASASLATLLLHTQLLVCCIHRLNPQALADTGLRQLYGSRISLHLGVRKATTDNHSFADVGAFPKRSGYGKRIKNQRTWYLAWTAAMNFGHSAAR